MAESSTAAPAGQRRSTEPVTGPIVNAKRWAVAKRYRYLYPFVFVHINKTGGSSIEAALRIPFEHRTAREKIAEIGRRSWDRKVTFAAVRNPWDKVVSHFHYRVQTNQTGLAERGLEFGDWVRATYRDRDPRYYDTPIMFSPHRDWIVDDSGEIAVDRVLRFERLADDFAALMEEIGRDAALPRLKASSHRDYREYYDDETVAIVADVFAPDLELFGYEF
jgi:chondroitin 4-sulfotransferase 11